MFFNCRFGMVVGFAIGAQSTYTPLISSLFTNHG